MDIIRIIFICLILRQGSALECAVCLPSNKDVGIAKDIRQLFGDAELIECDSINWNASTEANLFRTCPEKSSGSCYTQKSSKWTARTCSPISVDDCQTANKIQYCYCKTDRCNSPMMNENQTTTTTTTSTTTTEPIADISNGAGKKSFLYIWLAICLLILVSK